MMVVWDAKTGNPLKTIFEFYILLLVNIQQELKR